MIGRNYFFLVKRKAKDNELKAISLAYYKNWIKKILFNYMKYLIAYKNIIITIYIQQN
jgi:hypothetical protein